MKWLLFGVTALICAVLLTQWLRADPGYVLVAYGGWTLESSLAVAAVLLTLLHLGVTILLRLGQAPHRLRDWERRRRRSRARRALNQGLLALAEGRWAQAEQTLLREADTSETPLLNYLSAARAAQQLGAYERRDHYLRLAHLSLPTAEVAVGLTQAELQLDHRQHEQALATLVHLRTLAPHHNHLLKLLAVLYLRLEDWEKLVDLLPELRRRRIEPEHDLDDLELRSQRGLLLHRARSSDQETLARHWSSLPRKLRCHPLLVDAYSGVLVGQERLEEAETLLRATLEKCWSPELVQRYGDLALADCADQLSTAEGWLPNHSNDATLLFCLGRVCLRNRLWGKARSYFEASIGAGGPLRPRVYRDLGQLLEQMGEAEAARDCYRKGLQLSTGDAGQPGNVVPINGQLKAGP
jgi:HemY protein